MSRRYYSSRTKSASLTLGELHSKLVNLYCMFRDKDFFKEKTGITRTDVPDAIKYKAAVHLHFKGQPFPIEKWCREDRTEDHMFDMLEFLCDHVSKPGDWGWCTDNEMGGTYQDYQGYDGPAGQEEFRNAANAFLAEYKTGFELTKDGTVLAMGRDGLQHILDEEIIPYDEENVDRKVRDAIARWRNRHLSESEKRDAVRELADVFEWLGKSKDLGAVLDRKDEAAIFEIANKFGIRHHDPKQKTNYDPEIWHSWMFHFYLATYHAVIKMLIKGKNGQSG